MRVTGEEVCEDFASFGERCGGVYSCYFDAEGLEGRDLVGLWLGFSGWFVYGFWMISVPLMRGEDISPRLLFSSVYWSFLHAIKTQKRIHYPHG